MEESKLNLNAPFLSVRKFDKNSDVNVETSDLSLEQVEVGSVPFVWEQIPGRSKFDVVAAEANEPFITPGLPPGRNQIASCREFGDLVLEDENETPAFVDSFYINCSLSGVRGFDDAKSNANLHMVRENRDFAMRRFLPATKAVALAKDKPRQINKMMIREKKIRPGYESGSINVARKTMGYLPRMCANNSLCIINSSMPRKAQITNKNSSDYVDKRKSKSESYTPSRLYPNSKSDYLSSRANRSYPHISRSEELVSSRTMINSSSSTLYVNFGSRSFSTKPSLKKPDSSSDLSTFCPPLPLNPQESWKWRSRHSISNTHLNSSRFKPQTNWEAAVKSSYVHRDRARYSEEFVAREYPNT